MKLPDFDRDEFVPLPPDQPRRRFANPEFRCEPCMQRDIHSAWRLFLIRRTLLTTPWLALCPIGSSDVVRCPELDGATSSVLYVYAVALLDDATKTQLSKKELKLHGKLGARLKLLQSRGNLIDPIELDGIKRRRNHLTHQASAAPTVEELNKAVIAIERQLIAWGLVDPSPTHKLTSERSPWRESPSPNIISECDVTIRVVAGKRRVAELKATKRLLRDHPGQGQRSP